MLVSAINLKHVQLEADANDGALFVRLVVARANEKLRQKRTTIATKGSHKWIAKAKATAKATALAKAKAKAKATYVGA